MDFQLCGVSAPNPCVVQGLAVYMKISEIDGIRGITVLMIFKGLFVYFSPLNLYYITFF